MATISEFLKLKCGLCPLCISLVVVNGGDADSNVNLDETVEGDAVCENGEEESSGHYCTVCFGLSSKSYQQEYVVPTVKESLEPYCQLRNNQSPEPAAIKKSQTKLVKLINPDDGNFLTKESPTVNLPWIIVIRAQGAIAAGKWFLRKRRMEIQKEAESSDAAEGAMSSILGIRLGTALEVYLRIKERLRSSLRDILDSATLKVNGESRFDRVVLSQQLHQEEAGYLGIHVLFLPPSIIPPAQSNHDLNLLSIFLPPSLQTYLEECRDQLQRNHYRALHPRKRFRGNDPTLKQGGDPRINLELRVRHWRDQQRKEYEEIIVDSSDEVGKQGEIISVNKTNMSDMKNMETSPSDRKLLEWDTNLTWLEKDVALGWLEEETSRRGIEIKHLSAMNDWIQLVHQTCHSLGQTSQQTHQPNTNPESSNQRIRAVKSSLPLPLASLSSATPLHCSLYSSTFRRPFHVKGTYTKSRRDVSQTPFYVSASDCGVHERGGGNEKSDGKYKKDGNRSFIESSNMIRKGMSSVEEEICPPLSHIGCGGISNRNNDRFPVVPTLPRDDNHEGFDSKLCWQVENVQGGEVAYGLCKFHASGREDMDVRMLLPPQSIAKSFKSITARPFVCELFDAYRLPSKTDLERVVNAINCSVMSDSACEGESLKDVVSNEKGWPQTQVNSSRYYGHNPNGVGVSPLLSLVPASAFSNLQSETEEKVKYYGCVCWTQADIASDEELIQKLGCLPWDEEEGDSAVSKVSDGDSNSIKAAYRYPLEIKQCTPLRVLHRRASDVRTRHILSLWASRIDDHWFRLRMSTSSGTYVKEFVHGDCGRTYPNVGSMLGGRTDITELDCEGIAL